MSPERGRGAMPQYSKKLGSQEPGCIVLLIDQSGSMSGSFGKGDSSTMKSVECARAVNNVLATLTFAAKQGFQILPRCFVGVVGYGAGEARWVLEGKDGKLAKPGLLSIAEVAKAPLRVEEVRSEEDGEVVDVVPIWLEPKAHGQTPMAAAFDLAALAIGEWAAAHPKCFPPIVVNITDGEPDDLRTSNASETRAAAAGVSKIETEDGAALLLNVHIASGDAAAVVLPATKDELPHGPDRKHNPGAELLFELSSILPDTLRGSAATQGFNPAPEARGFVYNADPSTLVRFLNFGSKQFK